MVRLRGVVVSALLPAACAGSLAAAQPRPPVAELPGVTVRSEAGSEPVEKSYRRMLRGMDLFEREHARAPQATLRFKLLPRRRGVDLDRNVDLFIVGKTVEIPVALAPARTFALERNPRAWDENAQVTPDRQARSMTWRAEVRTPGLPPLTRRLGDLRLECRVGMEAGLVSDPPSWIKRLFDPLENTPDYCQRPDNRYLFFAERPLFGVTLVDGARRQAVPVQRL